VNKILHQLASALDALDRKRRQLARESSGMAAIEMAFIFPFMLIVYFGLVDITNLLSAERRVTIATSTIADLVTQAPGTVSKADLNGFYNAVGPIMDPFPSSSVTIDVFDFRKSGSSAVQQWTNVKNGSCGGAPSTANLPSLMTDGNDLVLARVCITYSAITGKVFGAGPFTLHSEMVLRPRQAPTLDCSDC
jgi:Flp pilus assembly protein TadG